MHRWLFCTQAVIASDRCRPVPDTFGFGVAPSSSAAKLSAADESNIAGWTVMGTPTGMHCWATAAPCGWGLLKAAGFAPQSRELQAGGGTATWELDDPTTTDMRTLPRLPWARLRAADDAGCAFLLHLQARADSVTGMMGTVLMHAQARVALQMV